MREKPKDSLLKNVPVFDNPAIVVEAKNVNARIIVFAGSFLMTV